MYPPFWSYFLLGVCCRPRRFPPTPEAGMVTPPRVGGHWAFGLRTPRPRDEKKLRGGYGLPSRNPLMLLERPTGFEPATSSLGSWHSATELRPPGDHYLTTLPKVPAAAISRP